ncbi:Hypothetical predicted protein [Olea europaea subsp. europaea]|uniref:Uncharacterized protein n=1 Tax=Olea europaea subsp. europaea TaxID=158383 RepID=A0A8S0TCI9_OLEEU|nr:Hypothetical predicted protein [Olea europaea subsp. europaea]
MERERMTVPSSIPTGVDLLNDPVLQAKDLNHVNSSNSSFMPCYHVIANNEPRNREPPIMKVLEHLMNQMVEKKETQAQIIDCQNEIKANVNRLERSEDSRFETILNMSVGVKKHAAKGQETTEDNITPSNEAVMPNNEHKHVIQTSDESHSNVALQLTLVDMNVKKFVSNPSFPTCANDGNDTVPGEAIDDINYTEEQLHGGGSYGGG